MNNETLIILLVSACLIVNLITLIVVIKNKSSVIGKVEQKAGVKVAAAEQPVQGIVFCRSCGNQYDSTLAACPHCKTARS